MKYVILHGQGMAGVRSKDLEGRTPLQAARTPNMDRLAQRGELGLVSIPGDDADLGTDMTELALLGYDPRKYRHGQGAFEAAGLGVVLGDLDVAYRCSMVTLRPPSAQGTAPGAADVKKLSPQVIMDDPTAGGIDTEEARELIDAINEQLGSESIQFYPGSAHRHLMVWVDGKAKAVCTNPERIAGRPIGEAMPTGDGADILKQVMEASLIILRDHPINEERQNAGKKPANCLWLWGQGRAPAMPKLADRYQIGSVVVSTSDLHRGVGISAGLEAASYDDLASSHKSGGIVLVETVLRELGKKDLAYVHVDVPASAGDAKARVTALEEFDQVVVGPLIEGLSKLGSYRLLLVCDQVAPDDSHPRLSAIPFSFCQGPLPPQATNGGRRITEVDAEATKIVVRDATRLLPKLLA